MYATERHQLIVDEARRNGRVEVLALATELEVTPETIRRDLSTLERLRLVRRTHGGAIPVERIRFEPDLADRESHNVELKRRIAQAGLAQMPAEGAVLLDAGSTTAQLAHLIPAGVELTVVTNGLSVAMILAGRPGITLHQVGGRIRGRTMAAVDEWAVAALREVIVDVAFLGTNGISVARGLTTPDRDEAAVKRVMLESARRRVLLADHSKFETDHFARFGQVADLDVVVTDDGLDEELAAEIAGAGPEVVRA